MHKNLGVISRKADYVGHESAERKCFATCGRSNEKCVFLHNALQQLTTS